MHKYRPHTPPKINYRPDYSFIHQGTSREELDLHKTINLILPGVETVKGDRSILEGREIDIYIPKYRTGVEYNGLAFHSDNKDPSYHLWKTVLAEKKKVRLIHIWSDLWNNRRSQVVDYLSKQFGKYQLIPFDKCFIQEITRAEGKTFLENTHILGYDKRANHFIGIFYENYLVYVASFKVEKNIWNLLEECDRRTLYIEDSLAHSLSFIQEKYGGVKFTAELDRSLFDGSSLRKLGFKIKSCSEPHAHWTKDYKSRKLQESYTEEQFIKEGFHRFFDCGVLYLEK